MDTKAILKKSWPVLAAVVLFLLISVIYFSPVLEGKKLQSSDGQFGGMSKEITDYREATGNEALWTNSMFSGMPAYLISTLYPGELFTKIQKVVVSISYPVMILTFGFLFFFILCLSLDISLWVAFAASLAYGFVTFTFAVMATGHMTKAHTIAYLSLLVAGVLMAYKKNRIGGTLITAIALTWMLSANHLQMTYYAAILLMIVGITYLVFAIREKTIVAFAKTSVMLVVAVLLAVAVNFSRLYTTYEYGKYSMRSRSELTLNNENKTSGLDKDYILDYSYDLGEAMTAFIPRFKGGGMGEPLGENSNFYKELEKLQGKNLAAEYAKHAPLYWGTQPISGAPFYFGAVLCYLFVLSLFLLKGEDKWWLIAVVIVSFLLSLGKNFSLLSDLMLDYFPGYNKFRDVKNIIVIQQFAMALLGVLAIREIYQRKISDAEFMKGLKYATAIAGGIALIFAVVPSLAGNFQGGSDAQYLQMGWPKQLIAALENDRRDVLRADAFRALVFILLAAAGLIGYWKNYLKARYAIVLWVTLIFIDLWPVNKRYFNDDNFTSKREVAEPFKKGAADVEISKDKDLYYRVLNLRNPMADSRTSYFHKSLGGYHGAKMKRYNELFQYQIQPEMQRLINGFSSSEGLDSTMATLSVINMLNTKYMIYDVEKAPIPNRFALGNAWLVSSVKMINNADQEIMALSSVNPANEAVVNQEFGSFVEGKSFNPDNSSVKLTEYQPNYLKYEANLNGEQLAVFSEIYYPKGWKAFVDGKETAHFQVNYVLRAMLLPDGKHEVEFRFEPQSYFAGNKVSMASSVLLLLAIAAFLFFRIKNQKPDHEETETTKA